jgi:hypothetical protein
MEALVVIFASVIALVVGIFATRETIKWHEKWYVKEMQSREWAMAMIDEQAKNTVLTGFYQPPIGEHERPRDIKGVISNYSHDHGLFTIFGKFDYLDKMIREIREPDRYDTGKNTDCKKVMIVTGKEGMEIAVYKVNCCDVWSSRVHIYIDHEKVDEAEYVWIGVIRKKDNVKIAGVLLPIAVARRVFSEK